MAVIPLDCTHVIFFSNYLDLQIDEKYDQKLNIRC